MTTTDLLTEQRAAEMLNVSPSFVTDLLDSGAIQCRTVGTERRVLHADLIAYQRVDDARRKAALDELTREAEAFRRGY